MRIAILIIVLMALSFGGGVWMEYMKLESAQKKLASTTEQLAGEESTVRLCRLQDQLLTLVQETADKNYGDASALSTKFFNALSGEISSTPPPDGKSTMQSMLAQRDEATADLAKGDPAAHDLFAQMSASFRQILNSNAPQTAPSAP